MSTTEGQQATPATFVDALRQWLQEHPGEHRGADIARAMGVPTHDVAARLIYLSDRGEILRRKTTRTTSRYRAP